MLTTTTPSLSRSVNPAWNTHIFQAFNQFTKPLVYTPGDNEWTDCHKAKQLSSGSPLDELNNLRELFFARPGQTLGLNPMTVTSQATAFTNPADASYVENVMWVQGGLLFVTFNIPGGSNDDDELTSPWTGIYINTGAQKEERLRRAAANLRWLDQAFALAKTAGVEAAVILVQADMWDSEKFPALDNYSPFVQRLATLTLAFTKPVLLVNGDSHKFKVDTPMVSNGATANITFLCDFSTDPAVRCDLSLIHKTPEVKNFLRVVVQGSGEPSPLSYVKLRIDTSATTLRGVFNVTEQCYYKC